MLNELKNKERHQTLSYAYNQTEPILYAVKEIVPQERMIREGEEYVAVVMLLIGLVLIGVSYVEMMKIRLVVRKEELKEKVREIMEEGRMIEIWFNDRGYGWRLRGSYGSDIDNIFDINIMLNLLA